MLQTSKTQKIEMFPNCCILIGIASSLTENANPKLKIQNASHQRTFKDRNIQLLQF